jgi:hypothetical protein
MMYCWAGWCSGKGCRLQLKCDGTWWCMEGKRRGNWRMEWVASTLQTTSERGVASITTADAHTSAASSRLNWRPRLFKLTLPFRRKTKSGFCTCAITFQTQSTLFCWGIWVLAGLQVILWFLGSFLPRSPVNTGLYTRDTFEIRFCGCFPHH